MKRTDDGLFARIVEFPDPDAQEVFAGLVGLDEAKERLLKQARILFDPESLEQWSRDHHGGRLPVIDFFSRRPPLFLFAGDPGNGKTALAESFGDALARSAEIPVALYPLSLNARGAGAVGEMTALISRAFAEIRNAAATAVSERGRRVRAGVILLIDEADALAQSRELSQMHHEDRAGVNALIRGVDELTRSRLPAIVVMCTNRLDALDPAVRRRAADTIDFPRPTAERRAQVISSALAGAGLTGEQISKLAEATGSRDGRPLGCTYSDLTQRLLPAILLQAYPDNPVSFSDAAELANGLTPTPPFQEQLTND